MRQAWAKAHATAKRHGTKPRAEFGASLRQVWDVARFERGTAMWRVEQDVERARIAALPADAQAIVHARTALMLAEHNDTLGSHALVAAVRARLHSLQQAA